MKYALRIVGLLAILFAIHLIAGEQLVGSSGNAYVNTRLAAVRAPLEGMLQLSVVPTGGRIAEGEVMGSVATSRDSDAALSWNRPEMEMACPACPSLMPRSAAIGVSRLTGMNSEAISTKVTSDRQATASHGVAASARPAMESCSVVIATVCARVASPSYLARAGRPQSPQDLIQHNCMNHRQGRAGGLYSWEFARDGREVRVRVEGQLTFNSSIPMVDASVEGCGIAYVPEDMVLDHLQDGRLVQVLDAWSPLFPGYHLSYPSRRQLSPAMSIIVEALRHRK